VTEVKTSLTWTQCSVPTCPIESAYQLPDIGSHFCEPWCDFFQQTVQLLPTQLESELEAVTVQVQLPGKPQLSKPLFQRTLKDRFQLIYVFFVSVA